MSLGVRSIYPVHAGAPESVRMVWDEMIIVRVRLSTEHNIPPFVASVPHPVHSNADRMLLLCRLPDRVKPNTAAPQQKSVEHDWPRFSYQAARPSAPIPTRLACG